MKVAQYKFNNNTFEFLKSSENFNCAKAELVLVFGERLLLEKQDLHQHFALQFPTAHIIYNSTSGEIYNGSAHENTIVATAIEFDKTKIKVAYESIQDYLESKKIGAAIAQSLQQDNLKYILIISDGSVVNGSDLIKGLESALLKKIPISGGLAGDQDKFEKTLVGYNENPQPKKVIGIGFYGDSIKIGHGTMGGWDVFGPERAITKSAYNVVYEIGNKKALTLYKEYLGKYSSELPSSALLFPLSLKMDNDTKSVVRTIIGINEADQSMTFAGEMPQGCNIRFMKANLDKLISASEEAAINAIEGVGAEPDLALLISCVGRKIILGDRIDEEIESVEGIFGKKTICTGFYSYGEISPYHLNMKCELHNQTMTITTFSEK